MHDDESLFVKNVQKISHRVFWSENNENWFTILFYINTVMLNVLLIIKQMIFFVLLMKFLN